MRVTLKVFSQDAEIRSLHNIPRGDRSRRKKRRKWQLLRYMSCPGSGTVSAFLPVMRGLREPANL